MNAARSISQRTVHPCKGGRALETQTRAGQNYKLGFCHGFCDRLHITTQPWKQALNTDTNAHHHVFPATENTREWKGVLWISIFFHFTITEFLKAYFHEADGLSDTQCNTQGSQTHPAVIPPCSAALAPTKTKACYHQATGPAYGRLILNIRKSKTSGIVRTKVKQHMVNSVSIAVYCC